MKNVNDPPNPRNAEWHSAVSQIGNLRRVISEEISGRGHRLPNAIRRYNRLKICAAIWLLATALVRPADAQDSAPQAPPKTSGNYASDIATVIEAEQQAVQQAKEALDQTEDAGVHTALEAAIKDMEKAQSALSAAKGSPEKLGPAITAEQTAYQALLKATPREFRISRSRKGQNNGSNQANQRQLNQLDMKEEANRYETERQATAAPTPQQREQSDVANRLKELAQRQQDLNDRLKELQTALQAAKTDQEREDIQRQLKRLRDEERQMLADVDELRQKMEQSPNAGSLAESRQQLDQTRSDVQRAAQEMERNSPSQALAAGTRAQQSMQTTRDDLRRQTSSQFTDQMRELRNQARDLAKQEEDISKQLESLQNGERKLDNSAETQQLSDQLAKQQTALTNLLAGMRAISEQSENVEPLLSQKLYDTLRRADQRHTDNLLDMGSQLAQRGFLPQTSEIERTARTNINELRQGVESAAETVLGNENDALRYAQKELNDLTHQMEREVGAGGTNDTPRASARSRASGQSNQLASATGQGRERSTSNREGTNSNATTQNGQPGNRGSQPVQNTSQRGQPGSRDSSAQNPQANQNAPGDNPGNAQAQNREGADQNEQANNDSSTRQNGPSPRPGQQPGQNGQSREQAQNQQAGQSGEANASENAQAQNPEGAGQNQQANNNSPGRQNDESPRPGAQPAQGGQAGGRAADRARLTQLARQLTTGGDGAGGERGGPITGGDYINWADRMRDVEQVLDSPDLRYQLATVRERASALRAQYRQSGRVPNDQVVREQLIIPMTQVRVWLEQELARQANANSLVPLDRDPVPDNYSELVRKYYEKLGSAQ